jgi:Isocitrate/isopropylmalate dehydrogenase
VGGLGMAPAANIGVDASIFEAVHGSAPDLAGKGVANPLALMLAAAMMLDHIDRSELAHQLRNAVLQTLNEDKVRTGDLGRYGVYQGVCPSHRWPLVAAYDHHCFGPILRPWNARSGGSSSARVGTLFRPVSTSCADISSPWLSAFQAIDKE